MLRAAGCDGRRGGTKQNRLGFCFRSVHSSRKRRVDLAQRAHHPLVRHVHVLLEGISSGCPCRPGRLQGFHEVQEAAVGGGERKWGAIGERCSGKAWREGMAGRGRRLQSLWARCGTMHACHALGSSNFHPFNTVCLSHPRFTCAWLSPSLRPFPLAAFSSLAMDFSSSSSWATSALSFGLKKGVRR